MSRIRAKVNRGEILTSNELDSLNDLPDNEIQIFLRTAEKLMHPTVLQRLNDIWSEREKAQHEKSETIRSERKMAQIEKSEAIDPERAKALLEMSEIRKRAEYSDSLMAKGTIASPAWYRVFGRPYRK